MIEGGNQASDIHGGLSGLTGDSVPFRGLAVELRGLTWGGLEEWESVVRNGQRGRSGWAGWGRIGGGRGGVCGSSGSSVWPILSIS